MVKMNEFIKIWWCSMTITKFGNKTRSLRTQQSERKLDSLAHFLLWRSIDLMHWRHVSITTTPCWGSRLVALRAHVLLAERIGAHPLSQCAHPGQLGGEACRGLPSECMLGDGARGVPRLTPNTTGAPFCDVICIWSIVNCCVLWLRGAFLSGSIS